MKTESLITLNEEDYHECRKIKEVIGWLRFTLEVWNNRYGDILKYRKQLKIQGKHNKITRVSGNVEIKGSKTADTQKRNVDEPQPDQHILTTQFREVETTSGNRSWKLIGKKFSMQN